MVRTVDAGLDRDLSLLERLVNQNSGTMNLPGVRKVADMVRPEFEALGFKVRWIDQAAAGRAGHLIATHTGNGRGKRMLLIGHLDTVFEADSPFQRFSRDGDQAKGPGVGDDKGGIVVILSALRAMHAAGTLKGADIEVVLTGDEEDAGDPIGTARADLIASGKRADVALDFEGLVVIDGVDMGSVARRSSNTWTVTATARSGHSSGIFSEYAGDGAAYELARIIAAFRKELPEPNLTFNVGLMLAGAEASIAPDNSRGSVTGKTNIIPGQAIAKGDFRTLSLDQSARVRERMQQIVAGPSLNGAKATISFDPGSYPPMAPTDGNHALLDRLNRVNTRLGLAAMPALDPLKRGAGDVSFVAADVDSLAGLGPSSSGDHTERETVDIPSIARQAKRAALLMTMLASERR